MNKKLLFVILSGVFLVFSSVSAMSVSFYYSDTCPYCQQIKPFVMEQVHKYPKYIFGVYEVSKDENNHKSFLDNGFEGVPAFIIKTDDCREIKFTGANEKKLNCELQEMTTKECPTYPAGYVTSESYFIE